MKKKISSKTYLATFFLLFLVAVIVLGTLAYLIDPLYKFRVGNGKYFHKEGYSHAGMVKNVDYDTLILGSSMTQNFDTRLFDQLLGGKSILVGIGGIGLDEMIAYIKLAQETGRVKHFYICADIYLFTSPKGYVTPKYLFNDDLLSDLRYLLSYETYFRFIPISLAFTTADKLGVTLPDYIVQKTDPNRFTRWADDFTFSEDVVIANYLQGYYQTSSVDKNNLSERITNSIDQFFDCVAEIEADFTFFFPPYSALYWCGVDRDGLIDTYLDAKEYFVEKANKYEAEVFDFQTHDLVLDLNNYKDTSHYSAQINDYMTECFKTKENLITTENQIDRNRLKEIIKTFKSSHPEIFEQ